MIFKKIFLLPLLVLNFIFCAKSQTVFINEINHLALTKGVEIAGPANTNLLNWSIVLYDEFGDEDGTIPLNGLIPDVVNDFGFVWIEVILGFQDAAGGAALVNNNGELVQFLSYGALIKGQSGIAADIISKLTGTQEGEEDALQLTGVGMTYNDFDWDLPGGFTPGAINNGQEIDDNTANGNVLPVTWLYFKGEAKNKSVYLQWATSSEKNTNYFQVEHSSDGKKFEAIGEVKAAGNSQEEQRYEFYDNINDATKVYYRLAEKDLDGKIHFSEIINVQKERDLSAIHLFPNPATDKLWIDVPDLVESSLTINVFDSIGKRVLTTEIDVDERSIINIADLPKGSYFVIIKGANASHLQKIIKK